MKKILKYIIATLFFSSVLYGNCGSHPNITESMIQENIVGKSTDEGINSWKFERNEPRIISVLETKCDDNKATVVIDIKTVNNRFFKQEMRGMLRLNYEWIVNNWFITKIENLSFKQGKWRKKKVYRKKLQTPLEFSKEGSRYFSKANYSMALKYYKRACDGGLFSSCTLLGGMYDHGNGVKKDDFLAKEYYKIGCDNGDKFACNNLGIFYQYGRGGSVDIDKAKEFYKKGCRKLGESCRRLAKIYEKNKNTQDAKTFLLKAKDLFEKECVAENPSSCNSLAIIYQDGAIVNKNIKKANNLYLQACNSGSLSGCFNLGNNYLNRFGVYFSRDLAKKYFNIACNKGHKKACKSYKIVSKPFGTIADDEREDLEQFKKIASKNSRTITFWNEYGESIEKISKTSVLGSESNHYESDYIFSKILLSSSSEKVKQLMQNAVLKHADAHTNIDDIYLYLPYRLLSDFSTSKTTTLAKKRNVEVYTGYVVSKENGIVTLSNKILFDTRKGSIDFGFKHGDIKYFIVTKDNNKTQSRLYNINGEYAVIYMKSYGMFVIMDIETFDSTYVQMFILGKYDKNLFELVFSSHTGKIYKLKTIEL